MPGSPVYNMVCFFRPRSIRVHNSMALGVPDNSAIHAMFLFLFVVSILTLFLTVFCDPGICATETKDDLKPVCTIRQPFTRYRMYV